MKRTRIVAFLGIHGSGKTTQSQLLYTALRQRGVAARYVHQLAPQQGPESWGQKLLVWPLLSVIDRLLDSNELGRKPPNGQPMARSMLRRAAATATAALGVLQTWLRIVGRNAPLLVFDRYAYDSLIRARWRYGVPSALEPLFLRFVPVPDVVFYLEVEPEQGWLRHKGQEWSLEQLAWQGKVYRQWLKLLQAKRPNMDLRTIPSQRSTEEAHREIVETTFSILRG